MLTSDWDWVGWNFDCQAPALTTLASLDLGRKFLLSSLIKISNHILSEINLITWRLTHSNFRLKFVRVGSQLCVTALAPVNTRQYFVNRSLAIECSSFRIFLLSSRTKILISRRIKWWFVTDAAFWRFFPLEWFYFSWLQVFKKPLGSKFGLFFAQSTSSLSTFFSPRFQSLHLHRRPPHPKLKTPRKRRWLPSTRSVAATKWTCSGLA